jgi:hypothetical protein
MSTTIYDKRRTCAVCGLGFVAARYSRKYCSDKCRQRAHRKETPEDSIKVLGDCARKNVMGLVMYAGGHPDYSWRAQKRLSTLVIEILSYCPEKVQKDIYRQLRDIVTP